MQALSRISPNRDLAVDELYNSMSIYRNLAVIICNCFVYSGGDHVQSLHPSAALGPHHLPCSHMFLCTLTHVVLGHVGLIILIISNTIKSKNIES